jgi:hypothetical protein
MLSLTGRGAAFRLISEPGVNTWPATGLVIGAAAGGLLAVWLALADVRAVPAG